MRPHPVADDAYAIRSARRADFADIQSVERAAAERFRTVGMPELVDFPVLDDARLAACLADGALFVATHDARVVGFVACAVLDGDAHVVEIDVVPTHAGRKLGARLLDRVDAWAAERGISRLTLATFRAVPWNAPYYARLGFREAPLDALGPDHAADWEAQRASGLDLEKRLFMDRETRRPAQSSSSD